MIRPLARRTDPATSHEAASRAVNSANNQRARCLRHLRDDGPATADEIDQAVGWRETTAGRRLIELERMGFAVRTEERRDTRYGRAAYVWKACEPSDTAREAVGQLSMFGQ